MARIHSLLVAAAFVASSPFVASANTVACAERAGVVDALYEQFGETQTGSAGSSGAEVLEIYANENAQTWTILLTLPDRGLACLVAAGSGDADLTMELANLAE